ncbi:hypothetical protein RB195_022015 [Necator americanus]|uniref:Uncharacterized protein n=1 Tax=Necator americanus TaxID=51031 RepID=A0ABR1EDM9_NECAM
MGRQTLSACHQQPGESSARFVNRLLNLVRAATTGQDPSNQKERALEEFVARLRPDIRYYVNSDNPLTFEQAVAKATADRLINPVGAARTIEVKAVAAGPPRTNMENVGMYAEVCLARTDRDSFSSQHQQGIKMFFASMVFPIVDLFLVVRTVSTVEELVITLDSARR